MRLHQQSGTMRVFLLFSLLLVIASALPFGPKSGVIEATAKNYNSLLKTHKPVFVMFYAPWCGHCKQMHPDYEKFAKSMKGMARVIAVNGDVHRELSGQFGVQGFPTIKYYGMGDKTKAKPQDYQGQRKAGAMTKAAMALVKNDAVTSLKKGSSTADLDAVLAKASSGKVAILISNKNSIPPMWAVVAGSAQLSSAKFVFAAEKLSPAVVKALGVTSFPTIAVISKDDGAEGYATATYGGAVEYDGIAKFILGELNGSGAAADADAGAEEAPKEKKENKEVPAPSNPKPALPVVPTALAKHSLDFYCSAKAMKMKGKSPLCVIAASEETDLAAVHAKYANEPVLFFFATSEEDMAAVTKGLGDGNVAVGESGVLLLRAFKESGAKYAVMPEGEELDAFLGKALEGTITFKRATFPLIK